ncbi:ABC transporter ATP-binding protein [Frigoribacterium faeni]|uniref:ABC transporter ATP-binding protein n=1 Tax=Frigoribacterium faeni TaxID=145483 RepID=A0A7W3PKD7_9MICO|nr:ATP-binding cassette domain-containing protein [Frigoribacterium faeni]MBA8814767.1 iron complex transport system ATP-binding protein [Frigoribacterium faeni]MBA8814898.1 iron complex transport system ATP-binding protein [Frigoribacterium faeni]BFF15714.1 ATP-binding cassette domain-containing protein [Microbacterium flavescens]GEK83558.1 ABC transporter ATP-binding protein [Frigoribacterium faeni]
MTSASAATSASSPIVLDVADVRVRRAGRDLLGGVSLRVRAAEHWALIGPNGAGKTTLLTLCGALGHPSAGTVDVLGRRLGRVELSELRRHIGHVDPRHRMLGDNPVLDVVLTGLTGSSDPVPRWSATPAEEARARSLIASVGLGARSGSRWSVLSQGERGRALIARALVADPALLLLDEPATGLDVAAREHLLDTLDEVRAAHPDIASVTVTHHLEDLPASTSHAVLLRDGLVFAQGPADDVLTSERVSAAFDHPLVVDRVDGRWSARTRRG